MKWLFSVFFLIIFSCNEKKENKVVTNTKDSLVAKNLTVDTTTKEKNVVVTDVPILCYHNIDSRDKSIYSMLEDDFKEQIKMLADSGFQTVLPEDIIGADLQQKPLPSKPVMISFDDTRASHFNIAAPLLKQYNFKGVFFIMTVSIGKKGYMSSDELRQLSNRGHVIGAHSYDHPLLKNIKGDEWERQLKKPKAVLENILNKPVKYFAYPNGQLNDEYISQLQKYGYDAAFQLAGKKNDQFPLYAIRRLIVQSNWSQKEFYQRVLSFTKRN